MQDSEVPDVFRDLISEATTSASAGPDEDRKPLKKRRTGRSTEDREKPVIQLYPEVDDIVRDTQPPASIQGEPEVGDGYNNGRRLQTITDSEESEDSDVEWEEVGLGQTEGTDEEVVEHEPSFGDLSIVLGEDKDNKKATTQVRRKGITTAEKKRRLDIHKVHLLCLLYHVHLRNSWCNDEGTQAILRKLPSPKILSNLIPNPEFNQHQAAKCFMDGLQELNVMWSNNFSITALGMHKPRWTDNEEVAKDFKDFDSFDLLVERADFRKAAASLEGSQDVGAQLFCALLRGIGIEARLVCSLQCLPFASSAQISTPQAAKVKRDTIFLDPYASDTSPRRSKIGANAHERSMLASTSSRPKRISQLGRLVSSRTMVRDPGRPPMLTPKKKYHTSYPVYWVEAFNSALQKWIVVDPLATSTVNKPEKIEPPLNYLQNSLCYVVAFEDDSIAKDVTRRYAKAYNAKTRKFRVECTEGGVKWWKKALKVFRRGTVLDRDQVEDAALARKEASEGMPRNVQDFKGHPIYVLERHLKHNEVIHPKSQVGKINVGTATLSKIEPIYRRRDVHIVRSGDKWYRLGREVKEGEQPLRYAKLRKGDRQSLLPQDMEVENDEASGAGLYALFQTELYIPPPVVHGRVPRNEYGNLDIYVPSMVPPGGTHIHSPNAAKAARIVGVDYADAVTGFQFKGRHGTAVIQGVVVAAEFREAVETVIDGLAYAQEEAENARRSTDALRLWRRFLIGLRIAERVGEYEINGETTNLRDEMDAVEEDLKERQQAGGFFPGSNPVDSATSQVRAHISGTRYAIDFGGGFITEDCSEFGSSVLDHQTLKKPKTVQKVELQQPTRDLGDDMGGGFLPEDTAEDGGSFLREEMEMAEKTAAQEIPSQTDPRVSPVADRLNQEEVRYSSDASCGQKSTGSNFPHKNTPSDHSSPLRKTIEEPEPPFSISIATEPPELSTAHAGTDISTNSNAEEYAGPTEPGDLATLDAAQLQEPEDADESDEDRDSLPSEDPEDKDADPDWLVYTT